MVGIITLGLLLVLGLKKLDLLLVLDLGLNQRCSTEQVRQHEVSALELVERVGRTC